VHPALRIAVRASHQVRIIRREIAVALTAPCGPLRRIAPCALAPWRIARRGDIADGNHAPCASRR
jgi:hypothetical protein